MSETRLQRRARKFNEWMADMFKDRSKRILEDHRQKNRQVEKRKRKQFRAGDKL
jgi:hypothetical protein